MNAMGFLELVANLRVYREGQQRAPNKPLLLLYALGRVARGEERLVEYAAAEPQLKRLLKQFGKPTTRGQHAYLAYGHLRSDRLWDIPAIDRIRRTGAGHLSRTDLMQHGKGGFPAEIDDELRDDPGLVNRAIRHILEEYFPQSLHDDILSEIGLPPQPLPDRPPRDPRFRFDVLRVYGHQCAICGFNMRMDNDLVGLEAAHIRAHCDGGPDRIDNGLALCTLHHKAFDRGAVGLRPDGPGFRVMVSQSVNGGDATTGLILGYHGRKISSRPAAEDRPALEHVRWHTDQVFRRPALPNAA